MALRAALVFVSIYTAVFLGCVLLLSLATMSAEDGNHIGPDIAIAYATGAMEIGPDGALSLPPDGDLQRLAARNPRMWLIAHGRSGRVTFGRVPPQAFALLERERGALQFGEFQVPGLPRPFSDTSIDRVDEGQAAYWIAAGGVDPETLSVFTTLFYFLSQGLGILLLVFLAAGIVGTLIAVPLVTSAVRPVVRAASAIRPDHPAARLREEEAPRELLPLVRGFNAALDRLASELLRRRRFIADMAHELRTPLAVLSLRLDGLPDSPSKSDVQRVVSRLAQMVAQMLDVERLSLAGQRTDPVNLAALARETLAELAPMALAAGYELAIETPDQPVMVTGDEHALSRAVGNLIGNAVAHAGGNGLIAVSVSEWRTLEVRDEGPGVPPPLRPNLFEPFCREHHDRDGCGLGLHLVREIMHAHGGDALLVDSPRGAAFRLEFPAPAS